MIYLINYNNGSRWPVLPQNLFHLQKCLDAAGHRSVVWDFNLTKWPYEELHSIESGIIALGFISGYWPHQEALKIAEVIREHPYRDTVKFIVGGHGPSADAEYYLEKLNCDAVFVGSADISLIKWINDMANSVIRMDGYNSPIPSEGYNMQVSQYYGNYDAFDIYKRIRFPNTKEDEFAVQILSGRGCPYKCAFCFRMGENYRRYMVSDVVFDIERYARDDGIRHFQFSDELLMVSEGSTVEMLAAINGLHWRLGYPLAFDCNGRLNIASKYPELLKRMKAAGFRYINYGCESMKQEVLDAINKKQTVEEIKHGIENTLEAGLTPGLNVMWGNPGDDEKSLWDAVEFIKKYSDGTELRTIRPVTPYPGTELYYRLICEGRCAGIDDFYEHHVNSDLFCYHFMDGWTNEEANKALFEANAEIYKEYLSNKETDEYNRMWRFYGGADDPKTFRGFRDV